MMLQEQLFEGSDGVSSRPFTAADAEEMDTIMKTNRIFDRWLRNVMSQKSLRYNKSPDRLKLGNGEPTAPRLLEINWEIAIQTNTMIKEKPMSLD